MQNKPTPPKDYAKFSLLITYTYPVAQKRGRKCQTHRDDITLLKFENAGMNVQGLHPVEILYRKYLEEKLVTYCAIIFDNSKPQNQAIVWKVILDKGQEKQYKDERREYYDLETGCSFTHLINKAVA